MVTVEEDHWVSWSDFLGWLNKYWPLEARQDPFQRVIDLVETGAIRNPYFKAPVARARLLQYAS